VKTFTLQLQSATQFERIEGVSSFAGEDASGAFGMLAGHARLMTSLVFGLARYRIGDDPWTFLALPGGVLYFFDDQLFISTRRYLRDRDYDRISAALQEQLLVEEQGLRQVKDSLHRMEEEMLKRLWQMGRRSGGAP